MNTTTITFPTTKAAFTAYQEEHGPRPLNDSEKSLMPAVVAIINAAYADSQEGEEGYPVNLKVEFESGIDAGVLPYPPSAYTVAFFETLSHWRNTAYEQGRREAAV